MCNKNFKAVNRQRIETVRVVSIMFSFLNCYRYYVSFSHGKEKY